MLARPGYTASARAVNDGDGNDNDDNNHYDFGMSLSPLLETT